MLKITEIKKHQTDLYCIKSTSCLCTSQSCINKSCVNLLKNAYLCDYSGKVNPVGWWRNWPSYPPRVTSQTYNTYWKAFFVGTYPQRKDFSYWASQVLIWKELTKSGAQKQYLSIRKVTAKLRSILTEETQATKDSFKIPYLMPVGDVMLFSL